MTQLWVGLTKQCQVKGTIASGRGMLKDLEKTGGKTNRETDDKVSNISEET